MEITLLLLLGYTLGKALESLAKAVALTLLLNRQ
jgi:hypothetical protein